MTEYDYIIEWWETMEEEGFLEMKKQEQEDA